MQFEKQQQTDGELSRSKQCIPAVFAKAGEYWTIGYQGKTFSLKHVRGLAYLQWLLRHPGEEFHVIALQDLNSDGELTTAYVTPGQSAVHADNSLRCSQLGDAGELLDAKARADYKRRLRELHQEIDEAHTWNDLGRLDALQSEIEALTRELDRAVGLGGRSRKAASASERARVAVTRTVKAALHKINLHDSALGQLLSETIRTGTYCSYMPSSRFRADWCFRVPEHNVPAVTSGTASLAHLERSHLLWSANRMRLVGRNAEFAKLCGLLEQALAGQGQVVMIGGESGVGKTRLAAALAAEAAARDARVFAGNCYDRDEPIPFAPFVEILESALARASSPAVFRERLGDELGEMFRLLPQLRHFFPDVPPPLELPAEQSRRLLFSAIGRLLARKAESPLLLVLEDLHWADEGTLLLLNFLAQLAPRLRLMMIGTYRDFELKPHRPLAKSLEELVRSHLVHQIRLANLTRDEVVEMLQALSDGRDVPDDLADLFYSETNGNPFFIEELFGYLCEQGRLITSNGDLRDDLTAADIDVPRNVKLVIGRRLARLGSDTQRLLATAATIGRSFSLELLEASSHCSAELVLESLEEAERAGLISSVSHGGEDIFAFSHELTRQAVQAQLSAPRRRRLHLEIASALEATYPDAFENYANDLAFHLWQAGTAADPGKTVSSLDKASKRAAAAGAYEEASRHLRNALEAIKRLPQNSERLRRELKLTLAHSAALIAMRGYSAPELEQPIARMLELCDQLDDPMLTFLVRVQIWTFVMVRGEVTQGAELAAQLLRRAEALPNAIANTLANSARGMMLYYRGDFPGARAHLEQAIKLYSPKTRAISGTFQDPGVLGLSYLAHTLWVLGYPDRALDAAEQAIRLAREIKDPMSSAQALDFAAIVRLRRREPQFALNIYDQVMDIATQHALSFWRAESMMMRGVGLIQLGEVEEGTIFLLRGISGRARAGAQLGFTFIASYLAEAHFAGAARTSHSTCSIKHQ